MTPEDRELLKRAAAAELEDLPGIPTEVKKELRGSGSYDRANAADWAEEHWNDRSDDIFDNNCTNFASNAVHFGGGVGYRVGPGGTLDDDTWEKTASRGNSWLDRHTYQRSASWVQAPDLHDFMVEHGGREVSQADAQPGDLVFWEDEQGTFHHTAVVTGNIDGDVRYTQHSTPRVDASLDDRLAIQETQDGSSQQKIHIVRVNPNW